MAVPGAPTNLEAKAVSGAVWVSWSEVAAVGSYEVQRKKAADTDFAVVDTVPRASFVDDDVLPDTKYVYQVRAVNDDGPSPWSAIKTVSTPAESVAVPEISRTQLGLAVVVGIVVLAALWALNGGLAFVNFPNITATTTRESAIVQVGSYLVRLGLVLLVVTFIPAFAIWAVTSVRIKKATKPEAAATDGGGIPSIGDALEFLKAVPDILKVPSGFAALLLVLGVFLLVGGGLGSDGDSSDSASSSPSPSAEVASPLPTP
jgi:hypothetical protein